MTAAAQEMRLLRLDVRCPECGAPPRLRITEQEREWARRQPPSMEKQTYECHVRRCSHRYSMYARDFQRAS